MMTNSQVVCICLYLTVTKCQFISYSMHRGQCCRKDEKTICSGKGFKSRIDTCSSLELSVSESSSSGSSCPKKQKFVRKPPRIKRKEKTVKPKPKPKKKPRIQRTHSYSNTDESSYYSPYSTKKAKNAAKRLG